MFENENDVQEPNQLQFHDPIYVNDDPTPIKHCIQTPSTSGEIICLSSDDDASMDQTSESPKVQWDTSSWDGGEILATEILATETLATEILATEILATKSVSSEDSTQVLFDLRKVNETLQVEVSDWKEKFVAMETAFLNEQNGRKQLEKSYRETNWKVKFEHQVEETIRHEHNFQKERETRFRIEDQQNSRYNALLVKLKRQGEELQISKSTNQTLGIDIALLKRNVSDALL